jgi:hypothetical protein
MIKFNSRINVDNIVINELYLKKMYYKYKIILK